MAGSKYLSTCEFQTKGTWYNWIYSSGTDLKMSSNSLNWTNIWLLFHTSKMKLYLLWAIPGDKTYNTTVSQTVLSDFQFKSHKSLFIWV